MLKWKTQNGISLPSQLISNDTKNELTCKQKLRRNCCRQISIRHTEKSSAIKLCCKILFDNRSTLCLLCPKRLQVFALKLQNEKTKSNQFGFYFVSFDTQTTKCFCNDSVVLTFTRLFFVDSTTSTFFEHHQHKPSCQLIRIATHVTSKFKNVNISLKQTPKLWLEE